MDFNLTTEQQQIRDEIKKVCKEFPDAYWRQVDSSKEYPEQGEPAMARLSLNCSCGWNFFLPSTTPGHEVACPSCGQNVRVPGRKRAAPGGSSLC